MSRRLLLPVLALSALLAAPAAGAPFKPGRISVAVRGSGPDVILIPGLSSSRGVWNGTVAAVPGYRYHLVQVAGFAGTPAGGNSAGRVAAPVAEEIAAYIVASRIGRPAIVGHSMGGSIAMMIGARHPEAAGRIMVVDMLPSAARPFGIPPAAMAPLARLVGGEMAGADRLRRDLKSLVGRFGDSDWLESRNDAGVVGRSVSELLATDLTPELSRIRAPLTVVYACSARLGYACGAVSRAFRSAYSRRPGTNLVRIDRSGHTIMWDQPAAFQAALRAFLAGR
ncbi:MAG TPA: alpha/beta hydrolase [Allosphingosinicella sp.]|jgi:pimeloyl-ACP methyl ester carboxylesterase|nr:alpha/beta hydrolase [Allosphingosinicella sp.]